MQLVREHSVTVISARWAIVDYSWRKEWNKCAQANLHFKKKSAGGELTVEHSPKILAREEEATTIVAEQWLTLLSLLIKIFPGALNSLFKASTLKLKNAVITPSIHPPPA